LRGADDTTSPVHAVRSARALCAAYPRFAVGCWYRYFIELVPAPSISTGADVERTCRGLVDAQREGCIGAASLAVAGEAFEQTRMCARLPAGDAVPCLHGVTVQATEGKPAVQRRLINECHTFPAAAHRGCVSWFGLTLNLVTNGRFARVCPALAPADRTACLAGARRYTGPIVTFS